MVARERERKTETEGGGRDRNWRVERYYFGYIFKYADILF